MLSRLYILDQHEVVVCSCMLFYFCLFELMLYVPVNSYGHVGMLHPFYGTFNQNKDVMTSKKCFSYNHPSKATPNKLVDAHPIFMKKWGGWEVFIFYFSHLQ